MPLTLPAEKVSRIDYLLGEGWTQQKIATEVGVYKGTVANYKKKRAERNGEPVTTRGNVSDAIIECLSRLQPIKYRQIASEIDKTPGNVSVTLVSLMKKGEVKRVSKGVYALPEWESSSNGAGGKPNEGNGEFTPPQLPEYIAQEFHDLNLIEVVSTLNRWLANYTGPSNEPVAVEIVLAMEHVKRAIELRDERLKPLLDEALKQSGEPKSINAEVR